MVAMAIVGLLLLWLLLVAAYQILSCSLQSWRRHRTSKLLGCLPASQVKQRDRILGLDVILMQLRAFWRKRLLPGSARLHLRYGNTFTAVSLFQKSIATIEPENVQAILATKFHDFDLGRRLRILGPLLGRGIFTLDGEHWAVSLAENASSLTLSRRRRANLIAALQSSFET
jgi:hypothetical protein